MENQLLNDGLGELAPQELNLIKMIREKYRFGEITIETRDGLPNYILREVVRKKL